MENTDLLKSQLEVDNVVASHLYETAKWGKFLAIVGFVFCGLILFFAIFLSTAVSSLSYFDRGFSGMGRVVGIIYTIVAVIFFFPYLFLLRFSTKMKTALNTNDQVTLTEAFNQHRRMYKYFGILAIITICFYAFGIIIAIASAGFR